MAEGPESTFKFMKKSEEAPTNLHLNAVKRLAELVFGPEVKVSRPNESRDISRMGVTMSLRDTEDIPYYISYQKINKYGIKKDALIMVSLKGRRQRCYHCHYTEHWLNMFQNKTQHEMERTLVRRVERASDNVVADVSYATVAGEKKAAPPPAIPSPTTPPPPPSLQNLSPSKQSPHHHHQRRIRTVQHPHLLVKGKQIKEQRR